MLARSTGLGKSMINAHIKDLKPQGDLLVLHLDTIEPDGWHLRAAMQLNDVPSIIKGFMRPAVILFMIRSLFFPKRSPIEPSQF
jgi:hypothetical protein